MEKGMKFQMELLKEFRAKSNLAYKEASIYTVLLDLVDENDLSEVFSMLHNVATDLGKRKEIEDLFERAKIYKWDLK